MAIHTTPDSYTKLLIHSDTSNGSTTFVDSSPSGHTITATNANHTSSLAKFGDTSMHFDGDGDYLGVATSSDFQLGTGSFTLEAWVYLTVVDNHYNIFDTYSPGGTNGFLAEIWNNNTIAFYSEGGVDWQTPGGTELAVNTWYHLAWVRDGNNLRMFVNGVQQGSTVTLSASDNYTEGVLRIGGRPVDYHLSGYLDEIRISNVARWTDSFVPPNKPYSVVDDDFVTDVAGIEDESGVTTAGKDFVVKSDPSEASTDSVFSVNAKDGTELLDVRADGTINGVKIYRGLITQEMTEEPEVVVLENTIGTIVWTRYAEGEFRGTLSGAFPQEKTWLTMGSEFELVSADLVIGVFRRRDDNTVGIRIVDYEGNLLDGEMGRNPIEIRIYP